MKDIIKTILVGREELEEIITTLAAKIDEDYSGQDKHLLMLGILKGSVVFMGDLMKKLTVPVEIDFMKVSSYGAGTESSGNVNIILDLYRQDLDKCDVLIIEDIVDSGRTLKHLVEYLKLKGVKSVKTCTLLDKPDRRAVDFDVDYRGKIIPDEFVVGYGLDYDEKYRELPFVGVLDPKVYMK